MDKKIKIAEIAEKLGVNPSTVSRAMNPATRHLISQKKCQEILSFCDKLQYRPGVTARSLVTGKSYKIGLILGDIQGDFNSPFMGGFIKNLCTELQKNGYALTILHAQSEDIVNNTIQFLMSNIADGYIIGNSLVEDSVKKYLLHTDVPTLIIDNLQLSKELNSPIIRFSHDNSYQDVWEQIPPEFYGKILFCGHDMYNTEFKFNRIKNFAPVDNCINKMLFTPNRKGFFEDQMNGFEFAQDNFEVLKQQKLIWCASDLNALGIVRFLQSKNIVVGKDISLISIDNIEKYMNSSNPILSTIDTQYNLGGTLAAKFMLDKINKITTPPNLIINSLYHPRVTFFLRKKKVTKEKRSTWISEDE